MNLKNCLPIHPNCSLFKGPLVSGVFSLVKTGNAGDIHPEQNKFLVEIIIIG